MCTLFYIVHWLKKAWDKFTDGVQGKITYFVFSWVVEAPYAAEHELSLGESGIGLK